MMKTRTPTQIKELKNTNLNTEFSFLTRDCPQITTTNPSESATTHRSKLPHPNLIKKKKKNSASPDAIPLRFENETHHQTPICERIPPPNSNPCHHRNPPLNSNLSHWNPPPNFNPATNHYRFSHRTIMQPIIDRPKLWSVPSPKPTIDADYHKPTPSTMPIHKLRPPPRQSP